MIRRLLKVPAIKLTLSKYQEHRGRIKQILGAHGILWILDFSFDNVLYPWVLIWLGNLMGGAIMTLLSGIICFGLVIYYERSGTDWLGINVLEEVKQHGEKWIDRFYSKKGNWWFIVKIIAFIPSKIFLLILFLLKVNDFVAFITLSIYEDAFKTTVFLRHGRFDGLRGRDWFIFFASLIVSNLYWTLRWSFFIGIFRILQGAL